MARLRRIVADFFLWALAVDGAVLVLLLFLMFALGLCSMVWGRAFFFFTERIHLFEAGIVAAVVLGVVGALRWNGERQRYWLQVVIRYALAYVYLDYGFAKVFKGQFTTSLSTLDMPLGEISGFALAWRFFGYSYAYALFLAASEVVGAVLLFFRRTTLLASAILVPVALNIAVVNFTHGIAVKEEAVLLLLMALALLLADFGRLKALFWDHAAVPPRSFPRYWTGRLPRLARLGAIAFIVLFTLIENVTLYLEYERTTTPLHGAWEVESYRVNGAPRTSGPSVWKNLYIDSDRNVAIRTEARRVRECESDVALQPGRRRFTLTDIYTNGAFLAGMYEVDGPDRLRIRGTQGLDAIEVALRRRPGR